MTSASGGLPAPEQRGRPSTEAWLLCAVVVLVAVLLLTRLGDSALWQDEGQVAFLATTTLATGVPLAWDGRNLKNDQNFGHFFREDNLVWVMHTWLPMFLAAAGIAVGGHTAWAARLPFALCAVAAVPVCFAAVRNATGRRRLAWLTIAIMVTNAPFYLYARQANYYAPFFVLGIGLWWCVLRLGRSPRAWWQLAACAAAFYHLNALPFFGMYAAVGAALLTRRPDRAAWRDFAKATLLTMGLTLPFFLWAGTGQRGGDVPLRFPGDAAYSPFLYRTLVELGLAVCPLVLLPIALTRPRPAADADATPRPVLTAAVVVLAFILLFPVYSPLAFQRYYCALFPLLYLLLAAAIDAVWARRSWAGVLFLGLHILTTAGFALTWMPLRVWAILAPRTPQHVQMLYERQNAMGLLFRATDMRRYLDEITHEFTGPVETLVAYLKAEADADDLVLISYPHEPIAFYTNLRLCNRLYPEDPLASRFPSYISNVEWPDWVVHRAQYPNTIFDYDRFLADQSRFYERIELNAVDTTWENRPLPFAHRYRSATEGPRLVIWRRRPDAPRDPWHLQRTAGG